MIEVLFGESEAASMKAAKSKIIIGKTDGPTSVWLAGKKKPPERRSDGWIPGTAEEVICLGFMLDIGDIKEEVDSQYRKDLICSMYLQGRWDKDSEIAAKLQKAVELYVKELERFKRYLENGETVRIWYSDAPYSRCGFYHLCSILKDYENDIRTVKLPEYRVMTDAIVSYHSWGEVAAEEFAGFLSYEKMLSGEEVRMYTFLWSQLKEENSCLRAVVNGRVTGVPEDYYDFLIWKRFPEKPIKEARLIGDILGHYPIGIGDWWYAKRINYLTEQGRIKVVQDSEKLYARIIERAEGCEEQ